jgi:hypothetical protein
MNKDQLTKCSWKKMVRLRPIPRRFDGGPHGRELPPLDRDWLIAQVTKDGVPISLQETGHGITLNWDNILEYSSDPARGDRYGFLLLKVQLNMGGTQMWVEPLLRAS